MEIFYTKYQNCGQFIKTKILYKDTRGKLNTGIFVRLFFNCKSVSKNLISKDGGIIMTQNGIKITDLRAEIQTLVNSDPTKYNPNRNGKIDDGDELSLLLSEYQCSVEDLTKKGGKTMLTNEEKLAVDKHLNCSDAVNGKIFTGVLGGLATLVCAGMGIDNVHTMLGNKEGFLMDKNFTKNVDIETLVKDGSYTKNGRPAYDIGKYMKTYISEDATRSISLEYSNGVALARNSGGTKVNLGRAYARDIQGKPFVLREWKPGDPQFVKTGTKTVEMTKKALTRAGKLGLINFGLATLFGLSTVGIISAINKSYKNEKISSIKAEQTKVGQQIMEKRRQEEAQRAQREAALKQEELEYKERLNSATSGIENNISRADRKAKSVNKELDKIKEKVTSEE